jgi:hypothetical protein
VAVARRRMFATILGVEVLVQESVDIVEKCALDSVLPNMCAFAESASMGLIIR